MYVFVLNLIKTEELPYPGFRSFSQLGEYCDVHVHSVLIDCGSVPDNCEATGFLDLFCALQVWGAEELASALDLINAGGPLRIMPWTCAGKRI
jgi:hypothetical protein